MVYICTEDAFPARRLEQLRAERRLTAAVTDRILIEHVPDVVSGCDRQTPGETQMIVEGPAVENISKIPTSEP